MIAIPIFCVLLVAYLVRETVLDNRAFHAYNSLVATCRSRNVLVAISVSARMRKLLNRLPQPPTHVDGIPIRVSPNLKRANVLDEISAWHI